MTRRTRTTWLRAGAATLGVGAAMAIGQGVATADSSTPENSAPSDSAPSDSAPASPAADSTASATSADPQPTTVALATQQDIPPVKKADTNSRPKVLAARESRGPMTLGVRKTTAAEKPRASAPAAPVAASVVAAERPTLERLTPRAGDRPATPVQPPTGLAVLGWVRREVQRTFLNRTPTANPVTTSFTTAGRVNGELRQSDADGDSLSVTVTRGPQHGSVVVKPDGTYSYTPTPNEAYTGDDEFTVRISDAGSGFHLHGLAALLPGGGHSVEKVVRFDVKETTATAAIPVGRFPTDVAVSRDGSRAYVVNSLDGSVSVIDTKSNTVVDTFTLSTNTRGLALSPDGQTAYVSNRGSGGDPDFVAVMDTDTGTFTKIAVGSTPNGVAVNTPGTRAYVANGGSDNVSVIDTGAGTVVATIPVGDNPEDVALSPDGTFAYVTNFDDDTVSVIDLRPGTATTNTVVHTFAVGDGADGVAFSPDGTRAYVANFTDGSVSVVETASHTVLSTIPVGDIVVSLAVSPDGSGVYATNFADGSAAVIDTATNTAIDSFTVGDGPAMVAFTDSSHAYVTNANGNSVSAVSVL